MKTSIFAGCNCHRWHRSACSSCVWELEACSLLYDLSISTRCPHPACCLWRRGGRRCTRRDGRMNSRRRFPLQGWFLFGSCGTFTPLFMTTTTTAPRREVNGPRRPAAGACRAPCLCLNVSFFTFSFAAPGSWTPRLVQGLKMPQD